MINVGLKQGQLLGARFSDTIQKPIYLSDLVVLAGRLYMPFTQNPMTDIGPTEIADLLTVNKSLYYNNAGSQNNKADLQKLIIGRSSISYEHYAVVQNRLTSIQYDLNKEEKKDTLLLALEESPSKMFGLCFSIIGIRAGSETLDCLMAKAQDQNKLEIVELILSEMLFRDAANQCPDEPVDSPDTQALIFSLEKPDDLPDTQVLIPASEKPVDLLDIQTQIFAPSAESPQAEAPSIEPAQAESSSEAPSLKPKSSWLRCCGR